MKKIFTLIATAFCSATFAQVTNGGMEVWRTYTAGSTSLTAPNSWNTGDSIVFAMGPILCPTCTFVPQTFQNDTPHGGTYAAKLMSRDMGGSLGVAECEMTNTQISVNLTTFTETHSGGTPVTAKVDTVTAWIKYLPKGADSGIVNITAVLAGMAAGGGDSVVGMGMDISSASGNYVLSSPAYTKHTYVIEYTPGAVPDHIQIDFHTGFTSVLTDSTTMYVDDVSVHTMGATSVQLMHSTGVVCYPNPAGNTLHIQSASHQNTVAELYNVLGQRIATQPLTDYITEMNISNLSVGVYYVQLLDAGNKVIYNTRVVKQ